MTSTNRLVGALAVIGLVAAACSSGTLETSNQAEVIPADATIDEVDAAEPDALVDNTTTTEPQAITSTTIQETTTTVPEPTLCSGGAGAPGFETAPFWSDGDERTFEIVIMKEDSRTGTNGSSTTPYTVSATANEAGLITYEMTAGDSALDTFGVSADDPRIARIIDEIPKEHLVYTVDKETGAIEVQNIEEVRANVIETASLVLPLIAESSPADPASESLLAELDEFLETYASLPDESIAALFSQRAQILHFFDGISMGEGEQFEAESFLPNVFGGETIPAIDITKHRPELDDEGCEVVEHTVFPNPSELTRILSETFAGAFDVNNVDPEEFLRVENIATLQFDNGIGRVRRITATQELTIDGASRTETLVITDISEQ